jgi:aspartyl-tRNA synthetase
MNQQAEDLMMGAPAAVDDARLKELSLRIALPPPKPGAEPKKGWAPSRLDSRKA